MRDELGFAWVDFGVYEAAMEIVADVLELEPFVMNQIIEALRAEAAEAAHHDPANGIFRSPVDVEAFDGTANWLAARLT